VISEDIKDSLLDQLNAEFESAHVYLAMSAYCSHQDFNGAASWLRTQYEEERLHAMKVYDYLVDQGVHISLGDLGPPPSEFGTLLEVFEESLNHEQSMTARLNELSDKALKEKDHATYSMLQWFVSEQLEEEATISEIIAKLRLVNNDGYGLLMIDNELASRTTVEL